MASGASLFYLVIQAVLASIADSTNRKRVYRAALETYDPNDCGVLGECVGKDPAYDEVFKEQFPDK